MYEVLSSTQTSMIEFDFTAISIITIALIKRFSGGVLIIPHMSNYLRIPKLDLPQMQKSGDNKKVIFCSFEPIFLCNISISAK